MLKELKKGGDENKNIVIDKVGRKDGESWSQPHIEDIGLWWWCSSYRFISVMMMFSLSLSVPLNLFLLRMPCWKIHLFLSHTLLQTQTQTHTNHIPLMRSFVFRIFLVDPCISLFCVLLTARRHVSPFRYVSPFQSFTTSVPNALKVSFISQLPPKVAILTCYV